MSERVWSVYLSGEIRSDWRERIEACVRVVIRFGDKYRQWNAAFDAGYAVALAKPIITMHDAELDHALKEVDRAAQATARTAEQVVDVLSYVIAGKLP